MIIGLKGKMSMITSLVFVILFFGLAGGLILYPINKKKIDVIRVLPIVLMTIFCLQTLTVFLLNKFGIGIDIKSAIVVLVVSNMVVWFGIKQKKQIRKLVCPKKDIFLLIIPIGLVLFEAYHMFSGAARLSYLNDDAENHFAMALYIVRNKKIYGTYFNAYLNAMLIELASPWLSVVRYYKAFIAGDIIMHIVEIWMFYSVLCSLCKKEVTKYAFPIICALYFLGYPTFSFMRGNFVYWSTGGVLFLYLIYILIKLQRQWENRKFYYILLVLGIYGSVICNRLYAVVNTVCVFIGVIIIIFEKKKISFSKVQKSALIVAGMIVAAAGFLCRKKILSIIIMISAKLSEEGYAYSSLYKQFVLFIPILILLFVYVYVEKKRAHLLFDIAVSVMMIAAGMYWLCSQGYISNYYFYKIYYCLWIMAWLLVTMHLDILIEQHQLIYSGIYGSVIVCLALLQIGNSENNYLGKWSATAGINGDFFNLYENNLSYFELDYASEALENAGRYSPPELLDTYEYIWENYKDDTIWFLSDHGNYMQGRWFSTILNKTHNIIYENYEQLVDAYMQLDNIYIVIGKQSGIYGAAQYVYDESNVVYEDNLIVMIKSYGN